MALKWLETAGFKPLFYVKNANASGLWRHFDNKNQMEWVARMNNIRNRATETVNTDLIYT